MSALRPYQLEAVESVRSYWNEGGENPLVEMATGTGKSLTQAGLLRGLIKEYPTLNAICLVHVRELVEQNAQAMLRAWPQAPIGINSAGLNRRDRRSQILFASIQSVYKDGYSLGARDLVLIDEAHLVPRDGEGMYRTFLQNLRLRVPDLRVAGFTATPYRMGSGRLDKGEDAIFSKIVYEYGIGRAIADGWLSRLITKATATVMDVSGVKSAGGEYVQHDLEVAVDKDFITKGAVDEIIAYGADRRAWVAFCTGVKHANNVAEEIRSRGISCASVNGKTPKQERASILRAFKEGRLRCLTNCSVLTTGFDAPATDLIAMLRPTKSAGLYVQIVGRGTRLSPGKENCIVLDFAGNVRRHGPVDQITTHVATEKKKKDEDAGELIKECPNCHSLISNFARVCPDCDHVFLAAQVDDDPKHDMHADGERPILSTDGPAWMTVQSMRCHVHDKPESPTSMRVEFFTGMSTQRKWVCFEHKGRARHEAAMWWRQMRGALPCPNTVAEALSRLGELAAVSAIQVRPSGKFFEVVGIQLAEDESSPVDILMDWVSKNGRIYSADEIIVSSKDILSAKLNLEVGQIKDTVDTLIKQRKMRVVNTNEWYFTRELVK